METTHWQNTRTVLKDLAQLLTCHLCSRLVQRPNVLGGCQHFFCKTCVDDYLIGEACPECGMPSHAKDLMMNRQLNTAVLLVKQLDKIINPRGTHVNADQGRVNQPEVIKINRASARKRQHSTAPEPSKVSRTRQSMKPDKTLPRKHNTKQDSNVNTDKSLNRTEQTTRSDVKKGRLATVETQKTRKSAGKSENTNVKMTASSLSSPSRTSPISSAQRTPMRSLLSKTRLGNSPSARSPLASPSSAASPRVLKKNSKGETPLHVAVIKGDVAEVRTLLEDPRVLVNVKDHAGWTPLHEAVNHGHIDIAKLLLDAGAMVDTPGLDNDTPLHDAIQNNQIKCVRLLVRYGASQKLRNSTGLTAQDLATTSAMKQALKEPVRSTAKASSQGSLRTYNQAVILATGLSREHKGVVSKCASLIHAKVVTNFSDQVTHVVTGVNADGQCPRTIKYLQAVLTGKWILTLAWAETCLEYKEHVNEEPFEVPGASSSPNSQAPQRARINSQQQRPGLFDGCHFYFHGETQYPLPEKQDLINLVTLAGAHVLQREPRVDALEDHVSFHSIPGSNLEHCGYYVVNSGDHARSEMVGKHLCWTTVTWLLNSIAQFQFLPLEIL